MYWLSAGLMVFGVVFLVSSGTALGSLLGVGMIVAGAIVFWRNSSTKRYLDSQKARDDMDDTSRR